MKNYDEDDLELHGDDSENLEDPNFEEELKDDDEKQFVIDSKTSQKQKNNLIKKIGIGVGIGAAFLILVPLVVTMVMPKKKEVQNQIQQGQSISESEKERGVALPGEHAVQNPNGVVLPTEAGLTTQQTQNQNMPCNTGDPKDPNNKNNPNCPIELRGDNNLQQAQTQQPATLPQQTATSNNSSSNYSNGNNETRRPRSEKPMPTQPAPYSPKQISKPNSSYASLNGGTRSNGNSTSNNNNGGTNLTTSGTEGQSQAEADRINGSQNRIRPTNITQKADNVNTFLLSTGTYLPLTISTNMNSDNPSYFMGIVSQDVYSKNGQHKLLIPKGSKIIGNYKALSSNTATRMFMFVEKIILPTEEIIALSNENVVDLGGEIGTKGRLNSKFWQRLGNTVLALSFSTLDYYLDYRQLKTAQRVADNNRNVSSTTWDNILTGSNDIKELSETLGSAWKAPKNRIKVKVGTRLNVLVMNDLVLPEYKGR